MSWLGFWCFVLFFQLDTSWSYLGRGTSVERMPPPDWPVGESVVGRAFSWLRMDVGGYSSLWKCSPSMSGKVVGPGPYNKQAEQARKQRSFLTISDAVSAFRFLSWVPGLPLSDRILLRRERWNKLCLAGFDKWDRDFIKGLESGRKVKLALGKLFVVGCIFSDTCICALVLCGWREFLLICALWC